DSINYSFWGNPKWSIQFYDDTIDGSSALLFCIYSLFKAKESEDIFDYLEHMTIDEFELILKGKVPIPLLEKRYKTVANVSKIINQHMNGNFYQYIKNKLNSDELFEVIVKCFPDFEDIRIYNEKTIYFYKLAQLLTSDILHIIKLKEKVAVNYDSLVGCADYKIPQIMRSLGFLKYDKELERVVDNRLEIKEGSKEEIEIRASQLVIINYIYSKLDKRYARIDINDYLWSLSKNKNSDIKPYHLTRTTNY
ncbi:MAG: queuosine salvage family protein, partial [Bacilli bacterium]|nr:queuosine salvage family protein [Bacilli bacterium]